GAGGGDLPPGGRVAGLEDHRVQLGTAGHGEVTGDVELRAVVGEGARVSGGEVPAAVPVAGQRVRRPRLPQFPGGAEELGGPFVAQGPVQVAAAAEVLTGARVGAGE